MTKTWNVRALVERVESSFWALAMLFLLPALPLAFLGYGSDEDAYAELEAGVATWVHGHLAMSRHPGYWLHEAIVFFFNRVGGSLLVNLTTTLVSLLILQRLWVIAGKLGIRWRFPIVLCLAWNPWFLVASTSAMDYVWGVLFIVLSMEAYLADRIVLSGVLGGVAAGFRLGSIFTIGGAWLLMSIKSRSTSAIAKFLLVVVVAALTGIAFYVPSWLSVGHNMTFLQGHLGPSSIWTLKMHLGRVIYKLMYMFGIVADGIIVAILVFNFEGLRQVWRDQRGLVQMSIGAILGTLVLFAKYPIEYTYLLPALPFFLLVVGLVTNEARYWQPFAVVLASVSFWFFSFPVATPNTPGRSTDATFGVKMETGVLLTDIKRRMDLMTCHSIACSHAQANE